MSYIEDTLLNESEEIELKVNRSWVHYIFRLLGAYLLLGALFVVVEFVQLPAVITGWSNIILGGLAVVIFLGFYIQKKSEEYVVTSSRVITKEGIFLNNIYEIQLANIESLDIDQSFFGRLFSYATIEINGTGNEDRRIVDVNKPIEFRKAIQS